MLQRIMVPVDGSLFAEAAVPIAAQLAERHGAEVHLVFVKALGDTDRSPKPLGGGYAEYPERRLRPIAHRLRLDRQIKVVIGSPQGSVVEALARYAMEIHADLIAMATHGRSGVSRAVAGSFADDLLHAVDVPLLLLRPGETGLAREESFGRILVGLDGSTDAEGALATACALAKAAGATLVLAEVVVPVPVEASLAVTAGIVITDTEATQRLVDAATRYLEGVAAGILERDGITAEVVVDVGMAVPSLAFAAGSIVNLARDMKIDLVVLTTRERRGSRLLLRSVADRVLHETDCALLLCHKPVRRVERHKVHPRSLEAGVSR
jgi:nucleotide-binding universal stress UspA family protein